MRNGKNWKAFFGYRPLSLTETLLLTFSAASLLFVATSAIIN